MASVALQEIPEVVDSTARGPTPPRVFPVTPLKPCVNQFVAHLRHHVAMVIFEVANQCREQFCIILSGGCVRNRFAWAILGVLSGGAARVTATWTTSKLLHRRSRSGLVYRPQPRVTATLTTSKSLHQKSRSGLWHQRQQKKWRRFARDSFQRTQTRQQTGH